MVRGFRLNSSQYGSMKGRKAGSQKPEVPAQSRLSITMPPPMPQLPMYSVMRELALQAVAAPLPLVR